MGPNPGTASLQSFAGWISSGLNLLVGLASDQRIKELETRYPMLSLLQCCITRCSFVSSWFHLPLEGSAPQLQLSQHSSNIISSPCFFSPGFSLLLFSGCLNIPKQSLHKSLRPILCRFCFLPRLWSTQSFLFYKVIVDSNKIMSSRR